MNTPRAGQCLIVILCLVVLGLTAAAAEKAESDSIAHPVVTVTNAGAEPRRLLRYRPSMEKPYFMVVDVKTSMSMQVNDTPPSSNELPLVQTEIALQPKEMTPDGRVQYALEVTRASVDADPKVSFQVRAVLEKELLPMAGVRGDATVTLRGVSEGVKLDILTTTPRSAAKMLGVIQASLRHMTIPFPEEPVGQGAVWEVKNSSRNNDTEILETRIVHVESLDEKTCQLKIAINQSADDQNIVPPNLPPETTVSLKSLRSQGNATMAIRFDEIVPTSSQETSLSTLVEVSQGNQLRRVTTKANAFTAFRPGKLTPPSK